MGKKYRYLELLFFWFFGELETCESTPDLTCLRANYEKYLAQIESGNAPPPLILGYKGLTYLWHREQMTPLLFSLGMI
jgi:hypothetical protein